jgi:hypothetical protein
MALAKMIERECASCGFLIDADDNRIPDTFLRGQGLNGDMPMVICQQCARMLLNDISED